MANVRTQGSSSLAEAPASYLIPLGAAKGEAKAYARVSAEDAEHLRQFNWYLRPGGYAARQKTVGKKKQQTVLMHREVMGCEVGDGQIVDHINHDFLDNRRENLRIVTHAENHQNRRRGGNRNSTSKYRGVSWNKAARKWRASCKLDQQVHFLGDFPSEEEAARVAEDFRRTHMPFSTN